MEGQGLDMAKTKNCSRNWADTGMCWMYPSGVTWP